MGFVVKEKKVFCMIKKNDNKQHAYYEIEAEHKDTTFQGYSGTLSWGLGAKSWKKKLDINFCNAKAEKVKLTLQFENKTKRKQFYMDGDHKCDFKDAKDHLPP